jgi:tetratricopeptide (TPR) repeat protein
MGFDKTKALRAAEKHIAQGKIPAAIQEYSKIVEHDPRDFSALNMLGDLYSRIKKIPEAISCFTRIADHYCDQGFAPKAIAIYKKIERLDPGKTEVATKLAALYSQLGLIAEARAQYLIVADIFSRTGQAQQVLTVLKKIADLDPNNADIRLKLANSYKVEGFKDEAVDAFIQAGQQLLSRNMHDQAIAAFNQALEIRPHDPQALSGLVSAHSAIGSLDEVTDLLERITTDHPDNIELLSLLARAYTEMQNAMAAERVVERLVEQEPTNYERFLDVVTLHLNQSNPEAAIRVLSRIVEPMLTAREDEQLLKLLNEALTFDRNHIASLRMLARIHTWQRDDDRLRSTLERLAEAAENSGHTDDELYAYSQLIRLMPDHPFYKKRYAELGGQVETSTPLRNEPEYAPSFTKVEEVPTFESFMVSYEESVVETPVEQGAEFEWNSSAIDPDPTFTQSNGSFAINESSNRVSSGFQEFDFSTSYTEESPAVPTPTPEYTQPAAKDNPLLRQELESVDFYLAQGYLDIARDTLDMLERQFGPHTEITNRRKQLPPITQDLSKGTSDLVAPPVEESFVIENSFTSFDITEGVSEINETVEPVNEWNISPQQPAPVISQPPLPPANAGIDAGLAAVFDEFRSALEIDEAPASDSDYETHYNLGIAYQEMELLDEAVEEFQTAIGIVSPQDGTPRYLQCCNMLGHCFMRKGIWKLAIMWFQKGLEAPGHTEEEYQALRYELATAYEQMGNLERAIEVFTEVYGINVSYRGVAEKLRELETLRTAQ